MPHFADVAPKSPLPRCARHRSESPRSHDAPGVDLEQARCVREDGLIDRLLGACRRSRFGYRERQYAAAHALCFSHDIPSKVIVELHADRARLIDGVADQLRNIELERGVVRRHQG